MPDSLPGPVETSAGQLHEIYSYLLWAVAEGGSVIAFNSHKANSPYSLSLIRSTHGHGFVPSPH